MDKNKFVYHSQKYKHLLLDVEKMSLDDDDELLKAKDDEYLLQRWNWIKRARKSYNELLPKLCANQLEDNVLVHYVRTRLSLEKMAIRTYCFLELKSLIISDNTCFEMFDVDNVNDDNSYNDENDHHNQQHQQQRNYPLYSQVVLQQQMSVKFANQNASNSYFQSPIILREKFHHQQQQHHIQQRHPYFDMNEHLMAIERIMIDVKNMANIDRKSIEFCALGIDCNYFEKIVERMFEMISRDYWSDDSIQNLAKFWKSLYELPVNSEYCSEKIRSMFPVIKLGNILTYLCLKDVENSINDQATKFIQQTNFANTNDRHLKIYTITLVKLIANLYRVNAIPSQMIIFCMNLLTYISLDENSDFNMPSEFKMDCLYILIDTLGLESIKNLCHNRFISAETDSQSSDFNEIINRLYEIYMTANVSNCYSKHVIMRLSTIIENHNHHWR
ncbi:hypothetical protein HUG17_6274 [Dermatophagoides farinae]|uniref:Uncharacterized protein n=1 Tax=Dermatophagoides farinae TaxID=6954 RepID=A0A9D4SJ77_DERFA|nr:hypothetical protein HUG17_6274 [Dermatophagoides farinae]